VSQFTRRAGGYERLTRAKSWLREGYVDEVFRIVD
jgi:hypothetical protein